MAWFYTVLLAGCSAGIVAAGVVMTRRLFRDETLVVGSPGPHDPFDGDPDGAR